MAKLSNDDMLSFDQDAWQKVYALVASQRMKSLSKCLIKYSDSFIFFVQEVATDIL